MIARQPFTHSALKKTTDPSIIKSNNLKIDDYVYLFEHHSESCNANNSAFKRYAEKLGSLCLGLGRCAVWLTSKTLNE